MDWTVTRDDQKLSEIVDKALHEERQQIQTDEGVVVVISKSELDQIEGNAGDFTQRFLNSQRGEVDFSRDKGPQDHGDKSKSRNPLIEYLKNGPGFEGVDIPRDKSPARDVEW